MYGVAMYDLEMEIIFAVHDYHHVHYLIKISGYVQPHAI